MSPVRTLTTDDFQMANRGPRLFDRWLAKQPVANPLRPFDIELYQPPDEELLRHANELVAFISDGYDALLNVVYEHYLRTSEDKHWMKGCGVPRHLPDGKVAKYLRSRAVVIRRDRGGKVDAAIYISPRWNIEHGIHLGVVNGQLVPNQP